jgi:hypothetical protein
MGRPEDDVELTLSRQLNGGRSLEARAAREVGRRGGDHAAMRNALALRQRRAKLHVPHQEIEGALRVWLDKRMAAAAREGGINNAAQRLARRTAQ